MAGRILLIDGNSIGYASHHSKTLINGDMEVQAIFGFLKTLQSLIRNNDMARPLVLWDAGSAHREALFPAYKSHRDEDPKKAAERVAYKAQVPFIRELLAYLGVPQCHAEGYEADDLAGYFIRATDPETKITMVTGDCDWQQLVQRPTVIWHDPRRDGKWMAFDDFQKVTGAKNPSEFLINKAALGDKSDTIDGVNGVGAKCIEEITKHFGSIQGVVNRVNTRGPLTKDTVPDGFNTRYIKPINRMVTEDIKLLTRNVQLMNLCNPGHDKDMKRIMQITKGKPDMDAFFKRCLEMNFATITTRPKLWTDTFSKGD